MDAPLSHIAEKIKEVSTVVGVASWFGYDYSMEGLNFACPRCESVSSSRKTLRIYGEHRWHCFHCDEGGDEIDWLAGKLGVSKGLAIRTLASRLGISGDIGDIVDLIKHRLFTDRVRVLASESVGDVEAREVLRLFRASRFGKRIDPKWAAAWIGALRMARADGETVRARAVGAAKAMAKYCDDAPPVLEKSVSHLRNEQVAMERRDALLLNRGPYRRLAMLRHWLDEDARPFMSGCVPVAGEFQSGRIVFPVRDASGRTVGFGGRIVDPTISGHPDAKYLNSTEKMGFSKGRELFGFDLALPSMIARGRAVMVEGYPDVIAMHRDDVTECVAPCGSAMTACHAEMLSIVCRRLILIGDGDEAGREATKRWASIARGARLEVVTVRMPDKLDPDELLEARGPGSLRSIVAKAVEVDPMARVLRDLDSRA